MELLRVADLGEHGWSIQLEGGWATDSVVEERGVISNGYFGTSVVEFLCEEDSRDLRTGVDFDPEGNAFFAYATDQAAAEAIRSLVEPVVSDPATLRAVFERADGERTRRCPPSTLN